LTVNIKRRKSLEFRFGASDIFQNIMKIFCTM
jgi:hypothetical protein